MIFSLPDHCTAVCSLLAVVLNSKGFTGMFTGITRPQSDIALIGHIM